MNKRGEAWTMDSMPFYIFTCILLSFLFLIFVYVTTSYAANIYAVPEGLTASVSEGRVLGTECVGAVDVYTGRALHAVDWNRLDNARLRYCYAAGGSEKVFAYNLSVEVGGATKEAQTSNWYTERSVEGRRKMAVAVLKDGAIVQGTIVIEVQHVD